MDGLVLVRTLAARLSCGLVAAFAIDSYYQPSFFWHLYTLSVIKYQLHNWTLLEVSRIKLFHTEDVVIDKHGCKIELDAIMVEKKSERMLQTFLRISSGCKQCQNPTIHKRWLTVEVCVSEEGKEQQHANTFH